MTEACCNPCAVHDRQTHKMSADERHEEYIKLAVYTVECLRDLDDYRCENAKLRALCADIYEMAYHEYPSAFEAAFADRMRELGVEVDG